MGMALRIFMVHEDDSLWRLPSARFERLLRPGSGQRLPQYAGKRVRYVLVVLEMENRIPVDILRVEYSFMKFDSQGRLDPEERERKARLGVEMLPPIKESRSHSSVIDAGHRFAQKRYAEQYSWKPTPVIIAALKEAIFGPYQS